MVEINMIKNKITVLGHPFANIGRGYDARLTFKVLKHMGVDVNIYDIYKYLTPNSEHKSDILKYVTDNPDGKIQIFALNGDEVKPCFNHLGKKLSTLSYKIVYPQWELEKYPKEWAESLDLFDEIWAPTEFVKSAIEKAVSKQVFYIPLAIGEHLLPYCFGRRYFGLPDSDFLFLLAFDFTSFLARKNPWDVITAFKIFIQNKKYSRIKLVLKLNNSHHNKDLLNRLYQEIQSIKDYIIILDKTMTDIETKSLIRNCDCYLSLHRSEGWGRSQAEAMVMKIPVIATNYSGNEEFMSTANSFPVNYHLINLVEGEYPFASGQKWAQPDIDHAVLLMHKVFNKDFDLKLLENAHKTILKKYSISQVGVTCLNRLIEIEKNFL